MILTNVKFYEGKFGNHVLVFVHEDVNAEMITETIKGKSVTEFIFVVSDRELFSILVPTVKLLLGLYGNKVKYNLFIMSEPIPLRAGIYDYVFVADGYDKVKTIYKKIGGDEWNPAFADITTRYGEEDNNLMEEYDQTEYPKYYKVEE